MAKTKDAGKSWSKAWDKVIREVRFRELDSAHDADRTLLILFKYAGKDYRMRVACQHDQPGAVDVVEVASTDMLGQVSWSTVPSPWQGSGPSADWLIRRALWQATGAMLGERPGVRSINLGDIFAPR